MQIRKEGRNYSIIQNYNKWYIYIYIYIYISFIIYYLLLHLPQNLWLLFYLDSPLFPDFQEYPRIQGYHEHLAPRIFLFLHLLLYFLQAPFYPLNHLALVFPCSHCDPVPQLKSSENYNSADSPVKLILACNKRDGSPVSTRSFKISSVY